MPRDAHWTEAPVRDGYCEVHLRSYRYYSEWITRLVTDTPAPYTSLVFRGHRRDQWGLEPTLDRELKKLGKLRNPWIREEHLSQFRYAMRGRRGPNPAKDLVDDEWWALGQHHGLATPFLDWTASPFVAAYFAYCEENPPGERPSARRCVFALCRNSVQMKNKELKTAPAKPRRTLDFYQPLTDENPRLVNQAGLFTHAPDGVLVEDWVKKQFAGAVVPQLFKITFPDPDRELALRSLNIMNINHLTLFPDSLGASRFCDLRLRIKHY